MNCVNRIRYLLNICTLVLEKSKIGCASRDSVLASGGTSPKCPLIQVHRSPRPPRSCVTVTLYTHPRTPRTFESSAVMRMSLMFNSFGASSSSDSDRSVNDDPIRVTSNAKALINRGLCSHKLTIKAFACRPCLIDNIVTQFRPSNCLIVPLVHAILRQPTISRAI